MSTLRRFAPLVAIVGLLVIATFVGVVLVHEEDSPEIGPQVATIDVGESSRSTTGTGTLPAGPTTSDPAASSVEPAPGDGSARQSTAAEPAPPTAPNPAPAPAPAPQPPLHYQPYDDGDDDDDWDDDGDWDDWDDDDD